MQEDSFGSFSKELGQLLQQFEVEDDATSPLTAPSSARNGDSIHAPAVSGSLRDEEVTFFFLAYYSFFASLVVKIMWNPIILCMVFKD